MCNLQYHASWIMRMSALLRNPSHHSTTLNDLPVLCRHISQPRLAAENLREKRWPKCLANQLLPPVKIPWIKCVFLGYHVSTFQWDRCGGHNNLKNLRQWKRFFHCRNLCTVSLEKQQKPLREQVVPQNNLDFLHHQMIRLVTCPLTLNLREFQSQTFHS